MEATYDPFAILNVEPGVSLEGARASYRRLARLHHPDVVPEQERERATKLMAALNEAIAELERDFEGWSRRFGVVRGEDERATASVLSVEPRLLILSEANGFAGFLTVASPSGDGKRISLRYEAGLIDAERLSMGGRGVANFRVRVSPKVRALERPERVEVELAAPGHRPMNVTVAVEPFGEREDRAPVGRGRRGWWERMRGWL